MIVERFLRWSERAPVKDRAQAASALARAYLWSDRMGGEERRAAEAAMVFLLDDPSPKVRLALATALAPGADAPRAVILALAQDQPEVASTVLFHSPAFSDADLVDLAAGVPAGLQRVIAMRNPLSPAVCAAIAEIGSQLACQDLLENPAAKIASVSLRRLAERFGDCGEMRHLLLDRRDLPADVRHMLVLRVGEALSSFGFVAAAIGKERAARVTRDACEQATLNLAADLPAAEIPALVEHLRIGGRLTPAFLMLTLCGGNLDFFAAAIVSLTGKTDLRVRSILVDGRETAIAALYEAAGLNRTVVGAFVTATLLWRRAARSRTQIDGFTLIQSLIDRHSAEAESNHAMRDLLMLANRLGMTVKKKAQREHAMQPARAAA